MQATLKEQLRAALNKWEQEEAPPAPAPAPAPAASNTGGRPSWAVLTPEEKAAEDFRKEEARINRMIQAKDLAKKAQEAGVDTTQTT